MSYDNNSFARLAASRDSSMLALRALEYISAALISLPALICSTNCLRSSDLAKSVKLESLRLSFTNLATLSSDTFMCSILPQSYLRRDISC
jgi:hypothetical protein